MKLARTKEACLPGFELGNSNGRYICTSPGTYLKIWNWDIKSRFECIKVRKFQKQIILFLFHPKQPGKIILNSILASGADIFRLFFWGRYENKVCNLLFRFSDL